MESAVTVKNAINYVNYFGLVYQNFKFLNKGKTYEFYNITDDPGENNNLINAVSPYVSKVFKDILSAKFTSK